MTGTKKRNAERQRQWQRNLTRARSHGYFLESKYDDLRLKWSWPEQKPDRAWLCCHHPEHFGALPVPDWAIERMREMQAEQEVISPKEEDEPDGELRGVWSEPHDESMDGEEWSEGGESESASPTARPAADDAAEPQALLAMQGRLARPSCVPPAYSCWDNGDSTDQWTSYNEQTWSYPWRHGAKNKQAMQQPASSSRRQHSPQRSRSRRRSTRVPAVPASRFCRQETPGPSTRGAARLRSRSRSSPVPGPSTRGAARLRSRSRSSPVPWRPKEPAKGASRSRDSRSRSSPLPWRPKEPAKGASRSRDSRSRQKSRPAEGAGSSQGSRQKCRLKKPAQLVPAPSSQARARQERASIRKAKSEQESDSSGRSSTGSEKLQDRGVWGPMPALPKLDLQPEVVPETEGVTQSTSISMMVPEWQPELSVGFPLMYTACAAQVPGKKNMYQVDGSKNENVLDQVPNAFFTFLNKRTLRDGQTSMSSLFEQNSTLWQYLKERNGTHTVLVPLKTPLLFSDQAEQLYAQYLRECEELEQKPYRQHAFDEKWAVMWHGSRMEMLHSLLINGLMKSQKNMKKEKEGFYGLPDMWHALASYGVWQDVGSSGQYNRFALECVARRPDKIAGATHNQFVFHDRTAWITGIVIQTANVKRLLAHHTSDWWDQKWQPRCEICPWRPDGKPKDQSDMEKEVTSGFDPRKECVVQDKPAAKAMPACKSPCTK